MLKTLALILPVVIPSWRFFQTVEPSPRVQWAQLHGHGTPEWQEFRPRPQAVTPLHCLLRLFWNPAWNDTLFLVSCAERIQQRPTDHSITEIRRRVRAHLADDLPNAVLQFRLIFIQREQTQGDGTPHDGGGLTQHVVFLSAPFRATKETLK
tara:strand:- start:122682 stop:123137 length:456 start_codon:yes stop_codon:yes gene_type:complete